VATIRDIEAEVWKSVRKDIDYAENNAIAKKWRELKAQQMPIGVPVTDEIELEDGRVAQGFTSGHVLVWAGGETVEVH
jgi:uncharacterized protein with LGFP repeats